MRLGLVVALPEEARALARVMTARGRGGERARGREGDPTTAETGSPLALPVAPSPPRPLAPSPAAVHLLTGHLGAQPVSIAWAGAGARGAAAATDALLERGVEGLFAVGFAGALSPALRPGDLLAATEVTEPDGGRWLADAGWLAALECGLAESNDCLMKAPSAIMLRPDRIGKRSRPLLHWGRLVTARRVVATAGEKRRLGEQTGALAVDMESAAVARGAAAAGVPMMAVRAITDAADTTLPLDFEQCFDSDGQFRHLRLLGLLARRPLAVGGLLRLGWHSAQAGRALGLFVATYLLRCAGSK